MMKLPQIALVDTVVITVCFVATNCGSSSVPAVVVRPGSLRTTSETWNPPANLQAGSRWPNSVEGLSYIWIPSGKFTMGCSPSDKECEVDETPAHEVTLTKGFWIGQTEVTQEAYQRVKGSNPSFFPRPALFDHTYRGKLPVESVSWQEADSYCAAVGGRLPTEAEWEFAARAGDRQSRYGDIGAIAWYSGNSEKKGYITLTRGQTHNVGEKAPNAWGLFDMLGNASEWAADWYGKYSDGPATDPRGPQRGQEKVLRGGAWANDPRHIRASFRFGAMQVFRLGIVGFRCARDFPAATSTKGTDGLTYVWIPPGKFMMGCSPGVFDLVGMDIQMPDKECDGDEKPAHEVSLTKGFWIGQTEVTQEAYQRVMGSNPSSHKGAKLPVENVSWFEAKAYCEAIGGRLPTEAEWEFAARAGSRHSRYGDIDAVAWHKGNSGNTTHEVGQKLPNAWGLYDALGNVFEWVADWGNTYADAPAIDPQGPAAGSTLLFRGGSFMLPTRTVRVSTRGYFTARSSDYVGFRCAGN